MGFGEALVLLKQGDRIRRKSWNDQNMWIGFVESSIVRWRLGRIDTLPWIGMKNHDGSFVPWTPTQMDILANDWEVVPIN